MHSRPDARGRRRQLAAASLLTVGMQKSTGQLEPANRLPFYS